MNNLNVKGVLILERQLNVFRSVINPNTNKPLVNNYRVAQPANFRDVSFP
jgi:hypothetical protein